MSKQDWSAEGSLVLEVSVWGVSTMCWVLCCLILLNLVQSLNESVIHEADSKVHIIG